MMGNKLRNLTPSTTTSNKESKELRCKILNVVKIVKQELDVRARKCNQDVLL